MMAVNQGDVSWVHGKATEATSDAWPMVRDSNVDQWVPSCWSLLAINHRYEVITVNGDIYSLAYQMTNGYLE